MTSHNILVTNVKWAIKIHASSLRNDDLFFHSRLSLEFGKCSKNKIDRINFGGN